MLKRGLRVFGPALPLRAKASPDGWQSPFFPGRFHRWGRLQLSCCIYLQRLTDPAKGVGCSHREPGKRHLHNSPSQLPRNSLATLRVMRVRQRIQTNQNATSTTHRRCNYAHLVAYAAQHQRCPVFGCDSHLSRKRSIVRDKSLRAALAAADGEQACGAASVEGGWRGRQARGQQG